MSAPVIPVDAKRTDWPRLVALAINTSGNRLTALEAPPVRSVTATGDVTATDYLVLADATAGAVTMTLPAVAGNEGLVVVIKKTDAGANAVTIEGNGAETIDGAANQVLSAQYDTLSAYCDGSEWWIL